MLSGPAAPTKTSHDASDRTRCCSPRSDNPDPPHRLGHADAVHTHHVQHNERLSPALPRLAVYGHLACGAAHDGEELRDDA